MINPSFDVASGNDPTDFFFSYDLVIERSQSKGGINFFRFALVVFKRAESAGFMGTLFSSFFGLKCSSTFFLACS
jgi:hypothetical protein